MLGLIAVTPYLLLIFLFYTLQQRREGRGDFREAMMVSAVVWATAVLVVTELLGQVYWIKFWPVFSFWLGVNVFLLAHLWTKRSTQLKVSLPRELLGDKLSVTLIAATGAIILLAWIMAAFTPSNIPDVLNYHLPRQLMWIQQASLEHFNTPNDRLIMMPPMAEIIGLQFMLLSGGDAWANMPQCFAYLLGAVAVSLIARELKVSPRGQALSAFLFITTPMALHEASKAKNDLLLGALTCLLAWQSLRYFNSGDKGPRQWLLLGCNLGLVWITKGSGLFYAAPIMIFTGVMMLYRLRWRIWQPVALVAVAAILLNTGHWSRNFGWYGTPIYSGKKEVGGLVTNESMNAKKFASNAVRNLTLHFGTPSNSLNRRMEKAVMRFHDLIGQDINDPDTTLYVLRYGVVYEPRASTKGQAPVHVLLALMLPFLIAFRKGRKDMLLISYVAVVFSCMILFFLVLKWQPWGTRLQLTFFCLIAPALGAVLSQIRTNKASTIAVATAAMLTLFPALNSLSNPIFSKNNIFNIDHEEIRFRLLADHRIPQLRVFEIIKMANPKCVRFNIIHAWPYPMMRWMLDEMEEPPHFWGQVAPEESPDPEVMILHTGGTAPTYLKYPEFEERYKAVGNTAPYVVYMQESLARKTGLDNFLPHFVGWRVQSGLEYVKFLYGDQTQLSYLKVKGKTVRLEFIALSDEMRIEASFFHNGDFPGPMIIFVNDEELARHEFNKSGDIEQLHLQFTAKEGVNMITFALPYTESQEGNETSLSFTELRILEADRP